MQRTRDRDAHSQATSAVPCTLTSNLFLACTGIGGGEGDRKTEGSSCTGTPSSLSDSHNSGQLILENSFESPPTTRARATLLGRSHLSLFAPGSAKYCPPQPTPPMSPPPPPWWLPASPPPAPPLCPPPPPSRSMERLSQERLSPAPPPPDAKPRWCGRV